MAGSDRSQRTEAPTPKRKREARKRGQVAKSPELLSWASLLASSFLLRITVRNANVGVHRLISRISGIGAHPSPGAMLKTFGDGLGVVASSVLPLALGLMGLGVAIELAQVGLMPSFSRVKFKASRLNPFSGFKKLFSTASVWETAKALLRVVVVTLVVGPAVSTLGTQLTNRGMGLDEILKNVAGSVQTLVRNAAAVGLVLAATDYIVQRRRMSGQLRMTRQEVKEEFRQSEGDPRVKNVLRSRQLSISRNRMIASVALADVVIVNPTHYAIALAYDPSRGAPEVVARGAGVLAAKVREEAELHHVPIVEDPPLTRTLFRCCQVGDLVPVELYEAVAHVLAFVMGLRRNAIAGVRRAPRRGPLPEVPSGRRRPRRLSSRPNRPIRSGDARTARTRTGHGR